MRHTLFFIFVSFFTQLAFASAEETSRHYTCSLCQRPFVEPKSDTIIKHSLRKRKNIEMPSATCEHCEKKFCSPCARNRANRDGTISSSLCYYSDSHSEKRVKKEIIKDKCLKPVKEDELQPAPKKPRLTEKTELKDELNETETSDIDPNYQILDPNSNANTDIYCNPVKEVKKEDTDSNTNTEFNSEPDENVLEDGGSIFDEKEWSLLKPDSVHELFEFILF